MCVNRISTVRTFSRRSRWYRLAIEGALVSPYRRQLLRDVRTESRAIRSDLSASMLHLVDEDPRETLRRFVAGENVPVGGPFDNIEKAKEAGLAALTKAMALLNQKPGFRASRPGKA